MHIYLFASRDSLPFLSFQSDCYLKYPGIWNKVLIFYILENILFDLV